MDVNKKHSTQPQTVTNIKPNSKSTHEPHVGKIAPLKNCRPNNAKGSGQAHGGVHSERYFLYKDKEPQPQSDLHDDACKLLWNMDQANANMESLADGDQLNAKIPLRCRKEALRSKHSTDDIRRHVLYDMIRFNRQPSSNSQWLKARQRKAANMGKNLSEKVIADGLSQKRKHAKLLNLDRSNLERSTQKKSDVDIWQQHTHNSNKRQKPQIQTWLDIVRKCKRGRPKTGKSPDKREVLSGELGDKKQ